MNSEKLKNTNKREQQDDVKRLADEIRPMLQEGTPKSLFADKDNRVMTAIYLCKNSEKDNLLQSRPLSVLNEYGNGRLSELLEKHSLLVIDGVYAEALIRTLGGYDSAKESAGWVEF